MSFSSYLHSEISFDPCPRGSDGHTSKVFHSFYYSTPLKFFHSFLFLNKKMRANFSRHKSLHHLYISLDQETSKVDIYKYFSINFRPLLTLTVPFKGRITLLGTERAFFTVSFFPKLIFE